MRFRWKNLKTNIIKKITLDVKCWKWLIFQFKWIFLRENEFDLKINEEKESEKTKIKMKKKITRNNQYYAIMMPILRNS